jgi:uncharacterized protein YihD (DUF1040 family)
MKIRNVEELHKLLSKAWEIESQFETLAFWEGYTAVASEAFRSTLFQLISESEKHKGMVQELLDAVILPNGY